jgi:IS30 family transposase
MDDGSTERPMPMSMLGDRRRVQSLVFWPPIDFLQMVVAEKLDDHWSPQQISGWLKVEYLNDRAMRVSHETIYKSLFIQARGVLKKELISRLRASE